MFRNFRFILTLNIKYFQYLNNIILAEICIHFVANSVVSMQIVEVYWTVV